MTIRPAIVVWALLVALLPLLACRRPPSRLEAVDVAADTMTVSVDCRERLLVRVFSNDDGTAALNIRGQLTRPQLLRGRNPKFTYEYGSNHLVLPDSGASGSLAWTGVTQAFDSRSSKPCARRLGDNIPDSDLHDFLHANALFPRSGRIEQVPGVVIVSIRPRADVEAVNELFRSLDAWIVGRDALQRYYLWFAGDDEFVSLGNQKSALLRQSPHIVYALPAWMLASPD